VARKTGRREGVEWMGRKRAMEEMQMTEEDIGRTDDNPGEQGMEPGTSPGDQLRSLPDEAGQRGSRLVSARAMQARLFSVYDAAAAAEDALTLVQTQLTLTLDRQYYDAEEIEQMAAELDSLLSLESELGDEGLVPGA
jgi:hypothetical protein